MLTYVAPSGLGIVISNIALNVLVAFSKRTPETSWMSFRRRPVRRGGRILHTSFHKAILAPRHPLWELAPMKSGAGGLLNLVHQSTEFIDFSVHALPRLRGCHSDEGLSAVAEGISARRSTKNFTHHVSPSFGGGWADFSTGPHPMLMYVAPSAPISSGQAPAGSGFELIFVQYSLREWFIS